MNPYHLFTIFCKMRKEKKIKRDRCEKKGKEKGKEK